MTPFTVREALVLACVVLTVSAVVGWGVVAVLGVPVLVFQAAGIVGGPIAVIVREYAITRGWWPL